MASAPRICTPHTTGQHPWMCRYPHVLFLELIRPHPMPQSLPQLPCNSRKFFAYRCTLYTMNCSHHLSALSSHEFLGSASSCDVSPSIGRINLPRPFSAGRIGIPSSVCAMLQRCGTVGGGENFEGRITTRLGTERMEKRRL
jgi:hypothetical protein